jgi:hypothetical protein
MKLRFVEREIHTPVYGVNPILVEVKKSKDIAVLESYKRLE